MAVKKTRLKIKMPIDTDPIRLYDTLTNPIKLAIWFCNKAEINFKVRGAIRMEGENCAATVFPEKVIEGTITELEPNRVFQFSWPISGVESKVTFQIDDRGHHCDLTISHDKIPVGSLMTDAWIIHLYNLRSYLATQRPDYRFDYNRIDKRTIKRELFIETLPPVIFRALTNQKDLRVWFAEEAEVEPQVGGKYLSGWKDRDGNPQGPKKIIELVENRKLIYDWDYSSDGIDSTQVSWELVRIGEKTRVTLKHSGFDETRYNRDYAQGWHAYCLTLKDFCESHRRVSYRLIDSREN